MGVPTDYFVDPSINGASGAGTIGDPYGDLQHALDTVTRDSTNGDIFHIKAGTAEILTAALSVATYGTPTGAAELAFQGYTSAKGDGGIGEIDGNATYSIFNDAVTDQMWFVDIKMGNTGTAVFVAADERITFYRCELHTCSSTTYAIDVDHTNMYGCYLHDLCNGGPIAMMRTRMGDLFDCVFDTETDNAIAVTSESGNANMERCVFLANNTGSICYKSTAASSNQYGINGCSFYNAATLGGTASAIDSWGMRMINNNLIEGWSGVGGTGIKFTGETQFVVGNAFYNCATNISGTAMHLAEDNESLGASPFASKTTFQPADTGNVISGANPTANINTSVAYYRDKGAVQLQPAAGGGGARVITS